MQMVGYSLLGNSCGRKETKDATEFKYLYFNLPNLGSGILSRTICVKSCPKSDTEKLECFPTKNIQKCEDLKSYNSISVLDGFCIPTQTDSLQKVASTFSGMNLQSIYESAIYNKYIFLICLAIAFALSYLFSLLLEHFTWIIVTVSIAGILIGGTYMSIMSWLRYKKLAEEAETSQNKDEMLSNAKFYKWVAIILWTIIGIFLLTLLCLFSRLVLAVNVIRAAADFVTDSVGIVLVPVVITVISILYFILWCYQLMMLYSTGVLYHNPSYPWGKIKTDGDLS